MACLRFLFFIVPKLKCLKPTGETLKFLWIPKYLGIIDNNSKNKKQQQHLSYEQILDVYILSESLHWFFVRVIHIKQGMFQPTHTV